MNIQTIESFFLFVSTGIFTLSSLSGIILGRRSQIPAGVLVLHSALAASGIILIVNR